MLSDFLLFEKIGEINCIIFCVKNEIKSAKAFEILTVASGESTVSRAKVQLWYNRFKTDRKDVNDGARR